MINHSIYPKIGKIRLSTEYNAQVLVEEFWNTIVLKDKKKKVKRPMLLKEHVYRGV